MTERIRTGFRALPDKVDDADLLVRYLGLRSRNELLEQALDEKLERHAPDLKKAKRGGWAK